MSKDAPTVVTTMPVNTVMDSRGFIRQVRATKPITPCACKPGLGGCSCKLGYCPCRKAGVYCGAGCQCRRSNTQCCNEPENKTSSDQMNMTVSADDIKNTGTIVTPNNSPVKKAKLDKSDSESEIEAFLSGGFLDEFDIGEFW